jgi:hypothetical protein
VNPSALQGASDCAEYLPWLYWRLDAKPALVEIGRALARVNLEAVLIGNAAAGRGRRSRRLISIFLFETHRGILVASLDDIIRSKKAARPRDLAMIDPLEKAREAKAGQAGTAKARRAGPRK